MPPTLPGPLVRTNYLTWPSPTATAYIAAADPNSPSFNPANAIPNTAGFPNFGDAAVDTEQYHRALAQLHGSGLHAAGVAFGLQLQCPLNQASVMVLPGLAIDTSGRHIFLAVGGMAEVNPQANIQTGVSTLVAVAATGVQLSTAGLADGDYYVVVQWRESWNGQASQSDPNVTQWNDTPWLRLLPIAGVSADLHVVLGKVTLAGALVTTASYGDVGGLQRTSVSVPAQSVKLKRAVTTSQPGTDTIDWGGLRAREGGGLQMTVVGSGDVVEVMQDNGTTHGAFSKMAISAGQITARRSDGTEPVTIDANRASITAGTANAPGLVQVQNAQNGSSIQLDGSTGNVNAGGVATIGSNPLRFTSAWSGFPDPATNRAEISNDTGTYKTLMIVGNKSAGLGRRVSIWDRLEVNGDAVTSNTLTTGSNPVRFTSAWSGFPDAATNHAEISNDTSAFKTLMIVGNKSAGLGRRVSVWDRLEVNGTLQVNGTLFDGGGTPLMGNPARKVAWATLFASTYSGGPAPTSSFTLNLGVRRQFSAYVAMAYVQAYVNVTYNAACVAEIWQVDGNPTSVIGSGGILGNTYAQVWFGAGQNITFRVRAVQNSIDCQASLIAFYE
jgi:hypothetical protein